jgi:hypothetical protein
MLPVIVWVQLGVINGVYLEQMSIDKLSQSPVDASNSDGIYCFRLYLIVQQSINLCGKLGRFRPKLLSKKRDPLVWEIELRGSCCHVREPKTIDHQNC